MRFFGAITLTLVVACTPTSRPSEPTDRPEPAPQKYPVGDSAASRAARSTEAGFRASPAERIDDGARKLFRDANVDGAFVMRDLRRGVTTIVNPELARRGFLPASTFKIPNTLIGLETGVIPDPSFMLKWDGHVRAVGEWNRDHDLTSAMRNSVVWYYQEVARRVGEARMNHWVRRLGYGNRETGGGIDQFWLSGALRVSARQQVEFLERLHRGALPVSGAHAEFVRQMLAFEAQDGVTLRWKTGLTEQDRQAVGWMVGFVERGSETLAFATLLLGPLDDQGRNPAVFEQRTRLPRRLLQRLAALPKKLADSTRWN